jgi:hypothetical protein
MMDNTGRGTKCTVRRLRKTEHDVGIKSHIARQLRTNFMFRKLNDEDISELASQFEVAEYDSGHVIIEQGKEP